MIVSLINSLQGIKGNTTKYAILSCFDDVKKYAHLLKFDIEVVDANAQTYLYDKTTGEVIGERTIKVMFNPKVEKEPLYQLWHTIYSIPDQV